MIRPVAPPGGGDDRGLHYWSEIGKVPAAHADLARAAMREIGMFYRTDEHHGLPHDPLKSCIVPRPIGWLTTLDAAGRVNLAPFSFFNGIASEPPLVIAGLNGAPPPAGMKRTPWPTAAQPASSWPIWRPGICARR